MKNAVIYAYQASPEKNGLETQIEHCKKYCLDNSLNVIAVYQEEVGNRTERARLLESAKAGGFEVVVVRDFSRFSRNSIELLDVTLQLKESGVEIQTLQNLP